MESQHVEQDYRMFAFDVEQIFYTLENVDLFVMFYFDKKIVL